jgi:hypothetical protein
MTAVLPRRIQRQALPPQAEEWLRTGALNTWYFLTKIPPEVVWRENADRIVAEFAAENPGQRPLLWWRFDAPEPRRRLGGTGTPLHECSACALNLHYGVPSHWRRADQFYLNGTPIDPANPPIYESEATYLKRLGLLLPGEGKRLTEADFEPECIL